MGRIKKKLKYFGRYAWELFKGSLPASFMYFCAGTILLMLTLKGKEITWTNTKLTWTIVCIIGGAAYNALVSWAMGGSQYEMLVSGNVKRVSAERYGDEYKMSTHKEYKEYRVWKGFAIGAFSGIFPLFFGLLFGFNQTTINGEMSGGFLGIMVLISFLLSGWSVLPFYYMNHAGKHVSYFLSLLFVLVPVIVSGVFYVCGAYSRRNKAIREQQIAERAAQAEAMKEKKINYGGLPGTKPKKRK